MTEQILEAVAEEIEHYDKPNNNTGFKQETEQENNDLILVPLAEAAELLEKTTDALRMDLRRGNIEGKKVKNKVHIYVSKQLKQKHEQDRTATKQQSNPPHGETKQDATPDQTEIEQLRAENKRLSEQVSTLIELQQSFADERKREQSLRLQSQQQTDDLLSTLNNLSTTVQDLSKQTEQALLPKPEQPKKRGLFGLWGGSSN